MTLSWDWNGIMGRFCYKTMTCIDIEILMVNIKFQLVLSYSYCKKWKDANAPPLRLILQYSTQSYLIVVWRFSIIICDFFLRLCNVICMCCVMLICSKLVLFGRIFYWLEKNKMYHTCLIYVWNFIWLRPCLYVPKNRYI